MVSDGVSYFDSLPDELVGLIGNWVGVMSVRDYAIFQRTCQRMRSIMSKPSAISNLCRDWGAPVRTFHQLALFVDMKHTGLIHENRVAFSFASIEIGNEEVGDIKDSLSRLSCFRQLLNRYEDTEMIIDAHVGSIAPNGIAAEFSERRGEAVISALCGGPPPEMFDLLVPIGSNFIPLDDNPLQRRLTLNVWGKRISTRAMASAHHFSKTAKEGRGWVELYLVLDGVELPDRPSFYQGMHPI